MQIYILNRLPLRCSILILAIEKLNLQFVIILAILGRDAVLPMTKEKMKIYSNLTYWNFKCQSA